MGIIEDYIDKSRALPYNKRVRLMWMWVGGLTVVVVLIWIISIPGRFQVESGKLTLGNFVSQIKQSYKNATAPLDTNNGNQTPTQNTPTAQQPTTQTPTSDAREQSSNDVTVSVAKVENAGTTLTAHFTFTSSSDQLVTLPSTSNITVIQAGKTITPQTVEKVGDTTTFPTTLLSDSTVEAVATFNGVVADQPYQLSFNNLRAGTDAQPFSFAFNY